MNRDTIIDCFKQRKRIKHKNGNEYKLLHIGSVKFNGEWHEAVTYQEVRGMGRVFTRDTDNFSNFSCPPDIVLTAEDKVRRFLKPNPITNIHPKVRF